MAQSEPKTPPYADLGRIILEARELKGLSRRELGDAVGYTGTNTGITINKIERGELRPPDDRLHALADLLGLPHAKVDALGRRVTSNPAAAAQAWKANRKRIDLLNERTSELQTEVEAHYSPLQQARERIEAIFLGPFLDYAASLDGAEIELDEALSELRAINPSQELSDLDRQIQLNRAEIAGNLGRALTGTTAGGLIAGAAVGSGAAFATYKSVAALASASTGTAISSLAGVAATNATLAAPGGGSLAAGGFGIAGGTAVLAGIVALPALLGAGVALFWTSKKWSSRARDDGARISDAETQFDRTAERLCASFPWTTEAHTYLALAESASMRLAKIIDLSSRQSLDSEAWSELNERHQHATRLGVQLAGVILTVLPLPAMPTPAEDLSDGQVQSVEEQVRQWNAAVVEDATARTERIFAEAVMLGSRS